MKMLFELLLILFLGATVIACLNWDVIESWIAANTTSTSAYAELVKECIEGGRYKVVAGVFDRQATRIANQEWEAQNLDAVLQGKFRLGSEIRINV